MSEHLTPFDQFIASASRQAERDGMDVPEAQLCAAAACDWARVYGERVAASAAAAGPLTAQQKRAARRELKAREQSLRKQMLDARGVPLWCRILSLFAPPPWNTVLAVVAWLVPILIERWTDQPLELVALANPPGA